MLAALRVRAEPPELVIDVGLKVELNPVGPVADRAIVPANPFSAVTVIVELAELPD